MATPDYNQWLNNAWGWPDDGLVSASFFAGASGVVWGSNPPYTALDLATIYPKFLGKPTPLTATTDGATANLEGILGDTSALAPGQLVAGPGLAPGTCILGVSTITLRPTGTTTTGSVAILDLANTDGMFVGQAITGAGIPAGATIIVVGLTTLQISAPAIASASGVALAIPSTAATLSAPSIAALEGSVAAYTAPLIPLLTLNVYIRLATASLAYDRWCDDWYMAMALYVAHFATLWYQSEAGAAAMFDPAAAGLAKGILTSKSGGGVSASYQLPDGYGDWGAWALTGYGQQLIPRFKAAGAGTMLLW